MPSLRRAVQTSLGSRSSILQRIQGLTQPYAENAHSHFEPLKSVLNKLEYFPMSKDLSHQVDRAFLTATQHLMDTPLSSAIDPETWTQEQWQTVYHRARHLQGIREYLEHLRKADHVSDTPQSSSGSDTPAQDATATHFRSKRTIYEAAKALSRLAAQTEDAAAESPDTESIHAVETIRRAWLDAQKDTENVGKTNEGQDSQNGTATTTTILDRIVI